MAGTSPDGPPKMVSTGPKTLFWSMEADDSSGPVYRPRYGIASDFPRWYWPFLKGMHDRYRYLSWSEKLKTPECVADMRILQAICGQLAEDMLTKSGVLKSVDLLPMLQNENDSYETFRGFGLLSDDVLRFKVLRYTVRVSVNGNVQDVLVPGDVYALPFLVDQLEESFGPGYIDLQSPRADLVDDYLKTDHILLGLSYCTTINFVSVLDIS